MDTIAQPSSSRSQGGNMKFNRAVLGSVLALGLIGGSFAQTTTPPAATPPAATTCSVAAVNVSTAKSADLQKIPGIGAKLADTIVKAQPFKDEADLVKRVKGIGAKNIVKFRPCFLYK
jgi:competence protein ComEA